MNWRRGETWLERKERERRAAELRQSAILAFACFVMSGLIIVAVSLGIGR